MFQGGSDPRGTGAKGYARHAKSLKFPLLVSRPAYFPLPTKINRQQQHLGAGSEDTLASGTHVTANTDAEPTQAADHGQQANGQPPAANGTEAAAPPSANGNTQLEEFQRELQKAEANPSDFNQWVAVEKLIDKLVGLSWFSLQILARKTCPWRLRSCDTCCRVTS